MLLLPLPDLPRMGMEQEANGLFKYSPFMEHLGCLESLIIVRNMSVNICLHKYLAILFRMNFSKCSYRSKLLNCHTESLYTMLFPELIFLELNMCFILNFVLCTERSPSPRSNKYTPFFFLGVMWFHSFTPKVLI